MQKPAPGKDNQATFMQGKNIFTLEVTIHRESSQGQGKIYEDRA